MLDKARNGTYNKTIRAHNGTYNKKGLLMAALKINRLAAGVTQKLLSEKSGVPLRSIKYYESGERIPDVLTAQRLAAALGVSVSDIYPLDQNDSPRSA
jgi:putative transcriptional regulator